METSNIIPSVSFQMMTHTTPVLFTRFGYYWWNSWSRGSRTSQRSITFLMVVVGNIKISKTSLIYVSIKRTFPSRQSGFSFQLATGNGPVMELVVQWNIILQNEVCTDHSTTTFWTICGAGSMSRTFFGIDKEDMVEVREKMEKRFEDGKMAPGTRSSHHFIPQSALQIGHKLCSENDSFVDIHDLKIQTRVDIGDIAASSYISYMYNSLWLVGLVNKVYEEQDDLDVQFMHPHGPWKTFNWPQGGDSCYFPIKNIVCCTYYNLWKNLQGLWWRLWQNSCCVCKTSFVNSCWFDAVKTCYDVPYK